MTSILWSNKHEMIEHTMTITKTCIVHHFNGNSWTGQGTCMPTWALTTDLMIEDFRAKVKSQV